MERYQTVDDMLSYARSFHSELADFYQRQAGGTDDMRLQMTMNYLVEHERNLASALQRYHEGAEQKILQSWLDHVPELETLPVLEDVTGTLSVGKPEQDAVDLALEIDERLIGAYEALTRRAGIDEVAELFRNLAEQQRNEQRRLQMASLRMDDI